MAMGIGRPDEDDEVVSAINTTPLVDVMLVMLIIFLMTIPVAIQAIPVELPHENNQPNQTRPENIVISVNRDGEIFWGMQKLQGTQALLDRLKATAALSPQPEIQIRGDYQARYESVGRVVFACQRAGILKVGFVTEPAV
jgi:biopolymer transport protein ExbD